MTGFPISASVLGQTFQGQALGTQTWVCVERLLSVLGLLGWGTASEDWLEAPPHPAPQTHKPTSGVNFPWKGPLVRAPSFLSTSPSEPHPLGYPSRKVMGGLSPGGLLVHHSHPQDWESELGIGGRLDGTRAGQGTGPPGGSPGARPTARRGCGHGQYGCPGSLGLFSCTFSLFIPI